ncbi:MAG: DUF86 domain-containing protein [Candidatus Bipolaricaulota bacterium]
MGRLDRERILVKVDQLDRYLAELSVVAPERREAYAETKTKRACERLLQLCVEVVVDICALLVSGLRLGIPSEEDDLIGKLAQHGILSDELARTIRMMKGLRNVLVHEYAQIDDDLVFEALSEREAGFSAFRREIIALLER